MGFAQMRKRTVQTCWIGQTTLHNETQCYDALLDSYAKGPHPDGLWSAPPPANRGLPSGATNRTRPQIFPAIRRVIRIGEISAANPLPGIT